MKVYVKKKTGNSLISCLLGWIFLTIVLFGCILMLKDLFNNFIITFENILSLIFYLAFILVYFYMLLCPKRYKVCLVAKTIETYNEETIAFMQFVAIDTSLKGKLQKTMECYTVEDNPLVVGNDYVATISKFTGLISKID